MRRGGGLFGFGNRVADGLKLQPPVEEGAGAGPCYARAQPACALQTRPSRSMRTRFSAAALSTTCSSTLAFAAVAGLATVSDHAGDDPLDRGTLALVDPLERLGALLRPCR